MRLMMSRGWKIAVIAAVVAAFTVAGNAEAARPAKPVCVPVLHPKCGWDQARLRTKVTELVRCAQSLLQKVVTCRRPDRNVFNCLIQLGSELIKCVTSSYSGRDMDIERSIGCVEGALKNLENAVKCSGNSEWICLVDKIKSLVRELLSCRTGSKPV